MSKGRMAGCVLRSLLIAYIITGILVFAAAWITYKLELSDRAVGFVVVFIYIFANAVAGLYIGKMAGKRRFFWGLVSGFLYGVLLMIISIGITGGVANVTSDGVCTLLLCAGGGTLGGMIS